MHPYTDQYGALPHPRDSWLKLRGWMKLIFKNACTCNAFCVVLQSAVRNYSFDVAVMGKDYTEYTFIHSVIKVTTKPELHDVI